MKHHTATIPSILAAVIILTGVSSGQDCYDYRRTKDPVKEKVIVDETLKSDFFTSRAASLPWYIIKHEDGSLESALNEPITAKDKIPIEHTSNCVSTHQGEHTMDFCDAVLKKGVLEMEISGGEPAYASSLLVVVRDGHFNCYFKGVYPIYNPECLAWKIRSKKLVLKSDKIGKGKRLYAWISVVFDETSKGRLFNKTERYKIEGYLKPVVK